jgi:hypothetical protein
VEVYLHSFFDLGTRWRRVIRFTIRPLYPPKKSPWCKVVPVLLTEHDAMKAYWGSGGIAPRILDLGITWRWVVSYRPHALYSPPPKGRGGGTQWRGDSVERGKFPAPGITRTRDHPARSPELYHRETVNDDLERMWKRSDLPGGNEETNKVN